MEKMKYIHPFLFAVYPALFLYSYNINHFKESVLIIPLVLSLVFAAVIFLINSLFFRKLEISAIISSFIILIFFSYSRLKEPIKNIDFNLGNIPINADKTLFLVILLTLCFITFLIFNNKRYLVKINKILSVFSFILVIMVIGNTVLSELKLGRTPLNGLVNEVDQIHASIPVLTPDIYYIILDRYGGDRTLKDYGFDNSSFIDYLKSRGFYIAADSTSNYPKTFLSLGSSLNMEYLDFLTQKIKGGASADESFVTPLIQNSKVIQFLKSKGYSYIHVGSGWDATRTNPYADRNLVMTGGSYFITDEFTSGLLYTTLAAPIIKKLNPDVTAVSQSPENNDHRSRVFYGFIALEQISGLPGPKFVFAHILIPHDPYVVDKDCKPLVESIVSLRKEVENYINQLQCANKKTIEAVEIILANSKEKPVIIIQADEGQFPIQHPISSNHEWLKAGDDSLKEKFPILNAYYLPDIKTNPLYESITPVNTFRIVFNTYFNTNLPLLPDKNIIFQDLNNLYKFTDVTDRLKNILQ